ncbi:ABCA1 protein, partial [Ceuthmochares aereus]|nr:ABCA1 protein [Ceuthmochares aereus]
HRFGDGYTVVVRIGGPEPAPVENLMELQFPGIVLKERHGGLLQFQVSSRVGSLGSTFSTLAAHRDPSPIEDYSVSQSTLDQAMVFMHFAREQSDEDPVGAPDPGRDGALNPGMRLTPSLEDDSYQESAV